MAFRKAISMAIDRNTVSKLGEYGYAPPADAIGLSGLFPQWVTDPAVKKLAKQMATYNPAAAKKLLTDNGFTYKGSRLIDPKGDPVKLDIHVISGWSDWVASNQIITKNLRRSGSTPTCSSSPTGATGSRTPSRRRTRRCCGRSTSRGSPYGFFYANLSKNAFIPSGQDATATGTGSTSPTRGDESAEPVEGDARPEEAAKDRDAAPEDLAAEPPDHPVVIGARWSTYSTKYFHCFPTAKNFYADPIFTTNPDSVLLFTRICPGGKSGPGASLVPPNGGRPPLTARRLPSEDPNALVCP